MINELFNSVAGSMTSQSNGAASSVRQVQGKSPVAAATATATAAPAPAADAGKQAGSSAVVDAKDLQGMVEGLNELAQTVQRELAFSVDEDSGKTVIKVIDTKTDEVIRQIPPEDILEMQRHMGEMNGLLFRTSA